MLFDEFASLSGRMHTFCRGYLCKDADIILFLLGSSFHPATVAADTLRKEGIRAGVVTLNVLRPFPSDELRHLCMHAKTIVAADRQDSYGAGGGNMSLELRAALQDITDSTHPIRVLTRIYGLGGFLVPSQKKYMKTKQGKGLREKSYLNGLRFSMW